MIGLEQEESRQTDTFEDELCGVAQVGEESDGSCMRLEHKPDGIHRVVGHAEGLHLYRSDAESATGLEGNEGQGSVLELPLNRFPCEAIGIDRYPESTAESAESLDVIGMLVGDEDTRQALWTSADAGQALTDLSGAESCIDEQLGVPCLQESTITATTAAEDCEPDGHWMRTRRLPKLSVLRRSPGDRRFSTELDVHPQTPLVTNPKRFETSVASTS